MASRKKPSAKQLAARRKFARIMKSGGFKKRTRKAKTSKAPVRRIKRRSVKRVIRKAVSKRTMVKRRRSSSKRRSSSSGMVGQLKRLSKPLIIGLGVPAAIGLVGSAVGQPALGNNKIVASGASFLLGGPAAGITTFLLSGGLGGLLGGGSQNSMDGLA